MAIESVTIVDPAATSVADARIADQTVVIVDGRIERVGPASNTAIPEGARVIDGRGRFLLPGFWDMHVHFNRDSLTQLRVMGPLMIANGVTSARDMLGDCWEPCGRGRNSLAEMRDLQRRIKEGSALAPRLHALSSPLVHGPANNGGYPREFPEFWQPRTSQQGRELARFLAARGVDLVKTYQSMIPEAYFGLLEEAGRLGLSVSGHLPWAVHPVEAARAGVRAIEHARWPGMACNPEYEAFRAMYEGVARGESEFDGEVFARFRDAATDRFDEATCAEILRTLAEHDVVLVPTVLTREMDARAVDSTYRADSRRRYVPRARLRGWDRDLAATASGPPELLRFYREFFDVALRVTGMANEAGVQVLVGTDAFDTMVFPGFSYHDELVHLADAGLSPLEIVRATSFAAAEFLGLTRDNGTVSRGNISDLVLLDADPLADIRNTTEIRAVVFDGRLYDRADLDVLIQSTAEFVAGTR